VNCDYLQKFLFENLQIKGSFVRLDRCWQEILQRAHPDVTAQELLGEAVSAAALLTSNIKFQGSISLQVQSAGAMRFLLGQCNHRGDVRGVVRMREQTAESFLEQAILSINLEPEIEGSPYQGIVEMSDEGLVPVLERYFSQSEQLETRFWLGVGLDWCSGLMLQKMPGETFDADGWNRITILASSVLEKELQCLDSGHLIKRLFHEEDVRLFPASEVRFRCSCSTQKVLSMLQTLGEDDLNELIQERGSVEVSCEYCGHTYQFDKVDVARIFTDIGFLPPSSTGLH